MNYKCIIVIYIGTLFSTLLFAEGRAGENKTICLGQSTTVGTPAFPNECITWSDGGDGSTIINIGDAMPTVSPETTTVYTVTIVGPNFSYKIENAVTVQVTEDIQIEAIPLQCCWNEREAINENQFEITVTPSVEDIQIIGINPQMAEIPFFKDLDGLYNQEIEINAICGNIEATKITTIDVVDETTIYGTKEGLSLKKSMLQKLIFRNFKKLNCIGPDPGLSVFYQESNFHKCCKNPNHCSIEKMLEFSVSGDASLNYSCSVPFKIPLKITSINGSVGISASVSGGFALTNRQTCNEDRTHCVSQQFSANLTGSLNLSLVHSAINSGSLQVIGSGGIIPWEICYPPLTTRVLASPCFTVRVKGNLQGFSWFNTYIEKTVYKVCLY